MNIIIYNPFEEGTIKDNMNLNHYDLLRSHGNLYCILAHKLGCKLADYGISTTIRRGTVLEDFQLDLLEYNLSFNDIQVPEKGDIGLLMLMNIEYGDQNKLYEFVSKVDHIIYQSSDWELCLEDNFLLKSLLDDKFELGQLIKKKLRCILTPHVIWRSIYERLFQVPVFETPFLIRDYIPLIDWKLSEKPYRAFYFNTGEDMSWLEGFSVIGSMGPNDVPNYGDKFIQYSRNITLSQLVDIQSLSMYTVLTNRDYIFGNLYKDIPTTTLVDTHKLLECYYSGSYPVPSFMTNAEVRNLLRTLITKEDIDCLRKYIRSKHSIESNQMLINNIIKYVKDFIQ